MDRREMLRALKRAARKAGGPAGLARINKVTPQRVNYWLHHGKKLPAEFVLPTEAATGEPRYKLRPDIYPPELAP